MENFKFRIGDFVRLKLPKIEKEFYPPMVFMVIERTCHECPGGIQRLYHIRLRGREGALAEKLTSINEIELEGV